MTAARGRSGSSGLPRNLKRTFVYRPALAQFLRVSVTLRSVSSTAPGCTSIGRVVGDSPEGRAFAGLRADRGFVGARFGEGAARRAGALRRLGGGMTGPTLASPRRGRLLVHHSLHLPG